MFRNKTVHSLSKQMRSGAAHCGNGVPIDELKCCEIVAQQPLRRGQQHWHLAEGGQLKEVEEKKISTVASEVVIEKQLPTLDYR